MNIQEQILIWFEGGRNEGLTLFFTSVTILAENLFLVMLLAVLYWCIDKVKAKRLAWFVLFSAVGNGIVKNIVRMPRPYEIGVVKPLRVETATSYSFPSGHTQAVTSFWTGSMIILKTKVSVILGCVMILLTAFSRLYLGVHWPMDVLGAIGFGLVFVYFGNQIMDEETTVNEWHLLATGVGCFLVLILNLDEDLCESMAGLFGLCMGCYIEQKNIHFMNNKSLKNNVLRCLIGVLGAVGIYFVFSKLFLDLKIVSMIKNIVILLWVVAGAPYVFKNIAKI